MSEIFAPYASLADLHERLGKLVSGSNGKIGRTDGSGKSWDARDEHFRGLEIDGYIRRPAPAPTDVDPVRYAKLQAEWAEDERLFEAARVEHGRGSPAYRAAVRKIIDRPAASFGSVEP